MGSFLGALSSVPSPCPQRAVAIKGALDAASVSAVHVDEVFMGHVLQAGAGHRAPARRRPWLQAWDRDVPCTTVNKVCAERHEVHCPWSPSHRRR